MVRLIRGVWYVQAFLLLALAGILIGQPLSAFTSLPRLQAIDDLKLVEFFAPLGLGLGALTLQILRPSFGWLRESLSTAFLTAWVVALIIAAVYGAPWPVLLGTATFAAFNLAYVLRPEDAATPRSARPSASAEAPMLGRVWGFQMLYYAVCGLLALFASDWLMDQLLSDSHQHTHLAEELHVLHAAAALYFAMAILSHQAIGAQSDETWRGYCQAFLAAQWTATIAMLAGVLLSHAETHHGEAEPLSHIGLIIGPAALAVILPNAMLALINTLTLYDRRFIRRFVATMRRHLDGWWTLQAALLLIVVCVTWLAADLLVQDILPPLPIADPDGQLQLARDSLRLVAPLALGLVALTILALLRRDRRSRHDFALLFVVWGFVSIVARLISDPVKIFSGRDPGLPLADTWVGRVLERADASLPPIDFAITDGTGPVLDLFFIVVVPVLFALGALIAGANLLVWLFPDWRSSDEQYQGAADTKPRWVYRLCVWQAVFLALVAVLTAFFPQLMAEMVLRSDPGQDAIHSALATTLRGTAPFWAAMAATSAFTASSSHEWSWRGMCRWFACWQGLYVLSFVFIHNAQLYEQGTLLWPTLMALLAMLNVSASRVPLRVTDLAGQPRPHGLLATDLGPGLPLIAATMTGRGGGRAYHRKGVGATGTFELDLDPELPRTAFFAPRDHPLLCTARFSNKHHADDAALDARGCALSLSWPESDERLDLLAATGAFGVVSNVVQAMVLRWAPARMRRRWLQKSHAAREAVLAGLRRGPTSFAELSYHTQLVRLWVGSDAGDETVGRRCRLRLRPEVGGESGLPDARDEDTPWEDARRPGEDRPQDYLRTELVNRLASGTVRLKLEAQIGPAPTGGARAVDDVGAWYDAAVDWDEAAFPWRSVGTVVLDRALPAMATEYLTFDPGLGGGVIATPRSASWRDERSLAAAQVRVMRLVARLRLLMYRVMGQPPGTPEERALLRTLRGRALGRSTVVRPGRRR